MAIMFSISKSEMDKLLDKYFDRYGERPKAILDGSGYILAPGARAGADIEMRTWLDEDRDNDLAMRRAMQQPLPA